jgi:hypothetical protein
LHVECDGSGALSAVDDQQDASWAQQRGDLLYGQADASGGCDVGQADDTGARGEGGGDGGEEGFRGRAVHGDGKVVEGEEAEA